jgi:hypothetical protein
VRQVVNWLNLSTLSGLLLAAVGGATVTRAGRGTYLATGFRWRFPVASAFTLGNVILTRHDLDWCASRPALLRHEDRHCTQYAYCLGPVMVVLYVLFAAASWVLSGDHASYNPFERLANLADGGYPKRGLRFLRGRR